jgi:flagellar hook protein FlgE
VAGEVSTIQSLKAVDAWIDVINANINGGVRTAYKASRLKFAGSNADVSRAGTSTSLPLQFPEPALTTANTVIDFSQGAITASTENTHLAIQGEGFFLLVNPGSVAATGMVTATASTRLYVTRDGEFRTNDRGFLVHSSGLYLMTVEYDGNPPLIAFGRAIFNNLDVSPVGGPFHAVVLSEFLKGGGPGFPTIGASVPVGRSLLKITNGRQSLQYSTYGSTVFDYGWRAGALTNPAIRPAEATTSDGIILTKSLEASNASMTQSVPELSLAQKLFSALTKVLQIKQTNVDGVLNLVR